jgi:hypothetical protein
MFLEKWLTNSGEVVILIHRLGTLYSQEHSWYSFLLEVELFPGLGRIRSIGKNPMTTSELETSTLWLVG